MMASGGARARSGPPPDPNALRRDRDDGDWKVLPKTGRAGEPPVWPMPSLTQREKALWAQLWTMPQAIMWERQRQELEVALYVRRLSEAEKRGAPTNLSTLCKQMAEGLGLTTPGLLRNRWRIEDDAPAAAGDAAPVATSKRSRERFTVVPGGVA